MLKPLKTHQFFDLFDRRAAGDVFDSFKTVRHARARAQVRGSAGNRTGSCVGKAGVRLPACPKNAMSERLPVRIQHFFILFGQAGDRTRLRRFQNCAPRSSESSKSEQAGNRTRQCAAKAGVRLLACPQIAMSDHLPVRFQRFFNPIDKKRGLVTLSRQNLQKP